MTIHPELSGYLDELVETLADTLALEAWLTSRVRAELEEAR